MTIITLSNGKKVGNFSSPHPFVFEDGSVLPAVSPEEAKRLSVTFIEQQVGIHGDVILKFQLTPAIEAEMYDWVELAQENKVDVVFCPLPMIQALRDDDEWSMDIFNMPFRAIRIEDRIKKLVSIHKQCI